MLAAQWPNTRALATKITSEQLLSHGHLRTSCKPWCCWINERWSNRCLSTFKCCIILSFTVVYYQYFLSPLKKHMECHSELQILPWKGKEMHYIHCDISPSLHVFLNYRTVLKNCSDKVRMIYLWHSELNHQEHGELLRLNKHLKLSKAFQSF